MAAHNIFNLLSLLIVLFLITFIQANGVEDVVQDELTYEPDQPIEIDCFNDSNNKTGIVDYIYYWQYPQRCKIIQLFNIMREEVCQKRFCYNSQLERRPMTLRNATYLDTGLYTCKGVRSNQPQNERVFRKVYVYVTDKQHLLVPPVASGARQGNPPVYSLSLGKDEVSIGCSTTHPGGIAVLVTLSKENTTDRRWETIATSEAPGEHLSYDPQTGFVIKKINSFSLFNGTFKCSAILFGTNKQPDPSVGVQEEIFTIQVPEPKKPELVGNSVEEKHEAESGSEVKFICQENGAVPRPQVNWFVIRATKSSDDGTLVASEVEISIKENVNDVDAQQASQPYEIRNRDSKSQLTIRRVNESATYLCRFTNMKGTAEKRFVLTIPGMAPYIIVLIVLAVLAVLFVIAFVARAFYRQKRAYKELLHSRLRLLEGNLERINPDMPLDEQIDLLPYDTKWEFPIKHVILGKQLGVGQYGRVVQARADGLAKGGGATTVAIKMVKSQTDNNALAALATELKVLMHIGTHKNVVNLLGAVTKNIVKGDLMVMVEFCRNGNLQDFLRNNRRFFIDELDLSGNMSPSERESYGYIRPQATDNPKQPRKFHFDSKAQQETRHRMSKDRYWVAEKSGRVVPSRELTPELEEKRSLVVSTRDLIEWSYQIACGMNYLTKRKVLHGDLAARNVLLADDNIVKVGDFGLSRKIYQDPNYQKTGNEALPVKWMALESLIDRVFSSQSDVWSFGVTMWELFSLSKVPYPDVEDLPELIRKLKKGYRMEKPEFAPDNIGDIMSICWIEDPDKRPTFAKLEQFLGELIDSRNNRKSCYVPMSPILKTQNTVEWKDEPVRDGYARALSRREESIVLRNPVTPPADVVIDVRTAVESDCPTVSSSSEPPYLMLMSHPHEGQTDSYLVMSPKEAVPTKEDLSVDHYLAMTPTQMKTKDNDLKLDENLEMTAENKKAVHDYLAMTSSAQDESKETNSKVDDYLKMTAKNQVNNVHGYLDMAPHQNILHHT